MTMRRAVISFCLLTLCYSFANSLNLKNLKHRAGKNNFLLFVSHRYFERNYIWQTKNSWTRRSLHKEWDKSLYTCDGYTFIFPVMLFHWLPRHYWRIHEVISAILVCFPRSLTSPSVPGRVFGCQLKSIKDFQFSPILVSVLQDMVVGSQLWFTLWIQFKVSKGSFLLDEAYQGQWQRSLGSWWTNQPMDPLWSSFHRFL